MNTDYMPVDVRRHLDESWPVRHRVSQRLTMTAGHARADRTTIGTLEMEVAKLLAISLTYNQWVMLTTTGARWVAWDVEQHPLAPGKPLSAQIDALPTQKMRPWDKSPEGLNGLPDSALLVCEIQGCAVPTFLESAPAAAPEVPNPAAAADDSGQR